MRLSIATNFPEVQRQIDAWGKQARFAAALALTRTAQDVRAAEIAEIRRVFDRPTPYTQRSVFYKSATKANLQAVVWLKDDRAGSGTPATVYLGPQISGGGRALKRFERLLQQAGRMPMGYNAVPGAGARLDRYGNISYGQIIQIMSQLRITATAGSTRNMSFNPTRAKRAKAKAGGAFFSLAQARGKLPPGVYLRNASGAIKPVLVFVRASTYRPRFDFFGVGHRKAAAVFPAHFNAALARALATAR